MEFKGSALVKEAYLFAFKAHEQQKRKYTNEPYINHCVNVANIIAELPDSTEEMIAAALLHDTMEDCGVPIIVLHKRFGALVSEYVKDLSDVYTKEMFPDLNRKVRKQLEAERLGLISKEAKTIKLADLIDNTSTIVQYDPNFAKVYLKEKEQMLFYLTEGDKSLFDIAMKHIEVATEWN